MWWLLIGRAMAGAGPWMLGTGNVQLYAGTEMQRFTTLAPQVSATQQDEVDIDGGVSTIGFTGVVRYALLPRVEFEGVVPWYQSQVSQEDQEICQTLGLNACEETRSVGLLTGRGRVLLLDELFGSPVSLTAIGEARLGALTAEERARITNAGEGTLDLGAFVTAGRSGRHASGYVEAGWRYRFPNTYAYPELSGGAPAAEWAGETQVLAHLADDTVLVGPLVAGIYRPGGLDWYELDFDNPDRFGALRIHNVRVGGTLVVRNATGTSISISALQTIAARNNPSDTFILSLGIGQFRRGGGDGLAADG